MVAKNYLQRIPLTRPENLQTLVENRRVFNLPNCELSVYESYQEAYRVPFSFNDLVISSMVTGKKVLHLFDKPAFDYLPGETVLVPPYETVVVDFPDATVENPTQCVALSVDSAYVNSTLQYLNSFYNSDRQSEHSWKFQFNQYHFANDTEMAELINKLIRVCSSDNKDKNVFADLSLKELLIRLVQSQYLEQVVTETKTHNNHSRVHQVIHYIHEHLTERIAVDTLSKKAYLSRNMFFKWFKEQFGITPLEYINRERIKLAKQLLAERKNNVSDVSFLCGFNDVNYFVRLFKKMEGITPGSFQQKLLNL